MTPKNLTVTGALMLLVALFMPAVTIEAGFLSRTMMGYQTDLLMSGGAGLVLLLVALNAKPQAGKAFSPFGIVLSIIALLIIGNLFLNISSVSASNDLASSAMGLALPLALAGGVVGVIGAAKKEPALPVAQ